MINEVYIIDDDESSIEVFRELFIVHFILLSIFFSVKILLVISMKKKLSIIIIAIFGIALDQISKLYIASNLILYKKNPIINNFFNITYVQNKGAAWGILNNNIILLVVITVLALGFICSFIFKESNIKKLDIVLYGMLLSGIIGNFIDRIFRGYVIDFLDFIIFGYDFPVFNIADMLIVISVGIMIITYWRSRNENAEERRKD